MAETMTQPPKTLPPTVNYAARRPRRSFASRLSKSARKWASETFSAENVISGFKSLAWVIPMTLLIWIYAEREQTTHQSANFRVEAHNSDPNRVVTLSVRGPDGRYSTDFSVHADLSGPQARLQELRESLESGMRVVPYDVDQNLSPGHHPVPTSTLANDPLFVKSGLAVSNISPAELDVFVDPIEHREVPVVVKPGVNNLEGPAIFKPAKVIVSGPASALDAAVDQGKLVAYADLGPLTDPGMKSLPAVTVSLPFSAPGVSVAPTSVSADLTVRRSDNDGVIRSMPVWALYPPSPMWDKYRVECDPPNLFDVKVSGPPEMIKAINDPASETKPKAFFDVSSASPPIGSNPLGTRHEAELRFDFANTGLKISPEDTHKTISFTVVERKNGE